MGSFANNSDGGGCICSTLWLFVIYLQMTEVILLSVTRVYATNNMGSVANNSDGGGCICSTRVYGYWLSTYK